MNLQKKTYGSWPTPVEIVASLFCLPSEELKHLVLRYEVLRGENQIVNLANLVAQSYNGHSIKTLKQNASNFMEAIKNS